MKDLGPLALGEVGIDQLVSSPIQRDVLACLVSAHPGGVAADRLLEILWPDQLPHRRRLWTHISRLRSTLRASGTIDIDIESGRGDYRLVGHLLSDARRFESLVETARPEERKQPAAEWWADVLALWRGEYLEGFDAERFSPGRRERLRQLRLVAALAQARRRLDEGDGERVIADLEPLTAEYPYSEAIVGLVAVALHRSGRRTESLRRLQDFRRRLAEETGLEPGSELVEVEQRLARDESATVAGRREPARPDRLPRWRTSFVGRAGTVDRVATLIDAHPIVTLVGPGGVGKTRLAVESVTALPPDRDRVTFVDLNVTDAGTGIDPVVARSLGLAGEAGSGLRDAVLRHLRSTPRLLVLDNCDHVLDGVSELVVAIADGCPGCHILATSRERLRVADEVVVRVEPLLTGTEASAGPAMQLLADRAGHDLGALDADDRGRMIELCDRLDGLPLALELAANRLFTMPVADLLDQMDERFSLLTAGERTAANRHQTLAATVAWSTDQLTVPQHRVLVRCSSFAGRFTLEDAASVCRDHDLDPVEVRSQVPELVERSLVEFGMDDPPYRLLDTLRSYGRDRLAHSGEDGYRAERHAEHFAQRALASAADAFGPREDENLRRVLAQAADYRKAIVFSRDNGHLDLLADLVAGLATSTFYLRGAWIEPPLLVHDLAFTVPSPTPRRWSHLIAAAANTFQNRAMLDEARRTAALATEVDPGNPQAWCQSAFARVHTDPPAAIEAARYAVERCDNGVATDVLCSLNVLALGFHQAGDIDRAILTAERLIDEARRFRSATGEAFGHFHLSLSRAPGTPAAIAAARAAHALSRSSAVIEAFAGVLLVRHLLHCDADEARSVLLACLDAGALDLDVTYERFALGAAAAYFAVSGDTPLAVEIGRAIGAFHLGPIVGLAPLLALEQRLVEEGSVRPVPDLDLRPIVTRVVAVLRRGI